ncbi:hypothetical protein PHLCEN_2v10069 [Hermanssonia centrifuga]|uniref:UDP-N-acetylglucosamine transferase subunit ALG13 n=1 Tax=Hermanssonia centrifuga TaxID=98765 RepID=A0A2R6NNV9_9APHY|nr:hypothetical protein PHLCEN_2v10069 [Hermanssonia centrifuga]
MHAFVTVGSTRFDALVKHALSDVVIDVLRTKGYSDIVVQCGNSDFDRSVYTLEGDTWTRNLEGEGSIEVWKFKPTLQQEYERADLVISHAGSGTILDVLRLKKPIIVVPNPTLLDNHQEELASALADTGHVKAASPWPIIAQFLDSIPTGWVGLDSGTGNGKYLPLPHDRPGSIWTIGLDRSRNLLSIARTAGGNNITREVVWGDVLGWQWRHGAFDYAISIATIHHLSTPERRKLAVQDDLSKRAVPQNERSESHGQDVFVPWVLSSQPQPQPKQKGKTKQGRTPTESVQQIAQDTQNVQDEPSKIFHRYYHMFARGELRELVCEAAKDLHLHIGPPDVGVTQGIDIVQDGWERSNYYVELRRWEFR